MKSASSLSLLIPLFLIACGGPLEGTSSNGSASQASSAACAGLDKQACSADPQCLPTFYACDSLCPANTECCPFRACEANPCVGLDQTACSANSQCQPVFFACDSLCPANTQCCPFESCQAQPQ